MNIYKYEKDGKLYTLHMTRGMYLGDGPIWAEPYNHQGEKRKVRGQTDRDRYKVVGVR